MDRPVKPGDDGGGYGMAGFDCRHPVIPDCARPSGEERRRRDRETGEAVSRDPG
jgi:hypothetical protein